MKYLTKNAIVSLCIFVIVISLSACTAPKRGVLKSLGKYKDSVFYTQGEFQDYTVYAKYHYDSVDFAENKYFTQISESDLNEINEHLDDFESWIETFQEDDASCEIVVNYYFDRTVIDNEDYFYIESKKSTTTWDDGTKTSSLVYYDIYFFDTQTQTLYYFHNDI
ncbi:MAG: hypothetical protein IKD04_08780 [Clostridia bacterium]|nr:hypothetical protein [Clostridia bacterium]